MLDFEREPRIGAELERVLKECPQPFDTRCCRGNLKAAPQSLRRDLDRSPQPTVTILIFDRVPTGAWWDGLLGVDGGALKGKPLLVVAPQGSAEEVADVYSHGAAELLRPPLHPVDVLGHIRRLVNFAPASQDETDESLKTKLGLNHLVGRSPALLAVLGILERIACSESNVLIRGETGTGKELIAQTIHRLSGRATKPFVAFNCGSSPADLLAAQLFGHVKGAFTGAVGDRTGLVQGAEGGTLFLDEINSLKLDGQVMLLRLLDADREYRPVGASDLFRANVRIMAATNADLKALVQSGEFRQDLYHRLDAVEVTLPPLRERGEDALLLAAHFLKAFATESQPAPRLSLAAAQSLLLDRWSGNVRQLKNVIDQACLRCTNSTIQAQDLALEPPEQLSMSLRSFKAKLKEDCHKAMRDFLIALLLRHNGNKSQAAAAEGFEWHAFRRLLERYKVPNVPKAASVLA